MSGKPEVIYQADSDKSNMFNTNELFMLNLNGIVLISYSINALLLLDRTWL